MCCSKGTDELSSEESELKLWCCGAVVLWCCGAVDGRMVSEVALRRRIRGRSDDRRNKLYYIYMIGRMALAVPFSVPIPPKQWSSPH